MPTVIGVDSSTQSCKVLVVDLETGDIVSEASTSHPDGTEVNPEAWWDALQTALAQVGHFPRASGFYRGPATRDGGTG
jgi:xylulokinase